MSSFRAKGITCPDCRKLFSYSSDQAGSTVACPRCGASVLIDAQGASASAQPPPLPTAAAPFTAPPPRRRPRRSCLFRSCLIVFAGLFLLVALALWAATRVPFTAFPNRVPAAVYRACAPLVAHDLIPGTVQIPATLKDTDVAITVTRVSRECPTIYQAAIRQTSPTETTAFCIALSIANNGRAPVTYHTWRRMASPDDLQRAATLEDEAGRLHGMVSFGRQTWPVGATQQGVVQPGQSLTDILLFECDGAAHGPYLLTLPGENLGSHSRLRFRIADAP